MTSKLMIQFRSLYNNSLGGSIPSSIDNLSKLSILYVSLTEPQVSHFTEKTLTDSFRALNINHLNGTIPPSITNLTNLIYLFAFFLILLLLPRKKTYLPPNHRTEIWPLTTYGEKFLQTLEIFRLSRACKIYLLPRG